MTTTQESYHQRVLQIEGIEHEEVLMSQLCTWDYDNGDRKIEQFIPGQGVFLDFVRAQ